MPRVEFGNVSPIGKPVDPDTGLATLVRHTHVEQSTCEWDISLDEDKPREAQFNEFFTSATHPGGVWAHQSDQPPAWVECPDWPELEGALRGYWNVKGRPKGWKNIIGDPADASGEVTE